MYTNLHMCCIFWYNHDFSIQNRHAVVVNNGKEVTIDPGGKRASVTINGKPVTKKTKLNHMVRKYCMPSNRDVTYVCHIDKSSFHIHVFQLLHQQTLRIDSL